MNLDPSQSALAVVVKNQKETHLDTGFNVDGGDLLDDLGGAMEVNHSLVDPHLELVPGLGTLTYQQTIVKLRS